MATHEAHRPVDPIDSGEAGPAMLGMNETTGVIGIGAILEAIAPP
jgi:hypothetical protein